MFIRLFNGGDLTLQIIYHQMRKYNATVINEMVKDVGESIVANKNYGISMQYRGKLWET
jgi:hypothetical protein